MYINVYKCIHYINTNNYINKNTEINHYFPISVSILLPKPEIKNIKKIEKLE